MRRRVVVTGLGCVCPLGNDVSTAWKQCSEGQSGISRITRFDPADFRCQIAGEVKNFVMPALIPPKEIKKMDTFIHYAIAATEQAILDSGLQISESLETEVGVSLGVGIGGLPTIESCHETLMTKGPSRITPFFLPMTLLNMSAGQISILFRARGYNACTVSACASSNHSIGNAARIIERGDAKVMITGGAEATVTPLAMGGFSAMKALSTRNDMPEKASRPYDRDRDGFVLSEGSAVLILEDLEFARARGANIYCEVTGYGFSSDAYHVTSPSTDGPARSIAMALKDAGLNPEQVDYINAHGTSTPVGDINELSAIKLALGTDAASKVSISSTKSMHGHLLGAAAALEAVLTIKAMQNSFIPPTINIENIDPECDLDVTPNSGKERGIEHAISNSFGFGGTNASLAFSKFKG
ncbi:MAG: beta-ketoacyl-ACP synthase II [SAR324 cluster bacterium]|nr:beta-ketoacyl-ACP synthase II [SAR324 cluster bacterium]